MRAIGIDPYEWLFYEGETTYGRGLWPSPILTIATVLTGEPSVELVPETDDIRYAKLVFREDFFDAVTRLRRGRLYAQIMGSQPHQWHVQPHPANTGDRGATNKDGYSPRLLCGFATWSAASQLPSPYSAALLALGPRSAYTLWRIVDIERIVTGEDLITIRARSSLGLLPELNRTIVPEQQLTKVQERLDALVQVAHTSGPASVIDRARDAVQLCLGVWLAKEQNDAKLLTKDLGELVSKLPQEHHVRYAVARIVARLHSRVKPNEAERYETRVVTEADGEFALASVGLLLRELGWAK